MYKIRQDKKEFLLRIPQTYYAKELGLTTTHFCRVMGGINCSKMIAKGMLSIRFQKPIDSLEIEQLLEEYFEENPKEEE